MPKPKPAPALGFDLDELTTQVEYNQGPRTARGAGRPSVGQPHSWPHEPKTLSSYLVTGVTK